MDMSPKPTLELKSFALISSMLLLTALPLAAQTTDQAQIEKAIENYILGWRSGDTGLLEKAFDLDAGVVLWVNKSGETEMLKSMTLSELATNVKPHEGYGIGYEILSVDIVNSQIAAAKVQIPRASKSSYYIDYLQLQKVGGQWKIALKSFVYFPAK